MTISVDEPNEIVPYATPDTPQLAKPERIMSVDAVRGLVMLTMIFVNDLAGAPKSAHVPDWMKHASDIRPKINDGMTFVDLVFPGFLFIAGLSIPFALGARLKQPGGVWKTVPHIFARTAALLTIGILMLHGAPDPSKMPWYHGQQAVAAPTSAPATATTAAGSTTTVTSGVGRSSTAGGAAAAPRVESKAGTVWVVLMYLSVFLAFASIFPFWERKDDLSAVRTWKWVTRGVRFMGFVLLAYLIWIWQRTGRGGKPSYLITFSPFRIDHGWYEILGLIGWAYLAAALVFVVFRTRRLPLAVAMGCLLSFWIVDRTQSKFDFHLAGFLEPIGRAIATSISWVNEHVVGIGESLGSLASITVGGCLLATILVTPETQSVGKRVKFTLMFIGTTAFAAMVLYKPWGIWKNSATPSWCLWACAITASIWLLFYLIGDVWGQRWLLRPLAIAGQNVLLAYLLSEGLESLLNLMHLSDWYDHIGGPTLAWAISRSLGLGIVLLSLTAGVNKLGFRLKL